MLSKTSIFLLLLVVAGTWSALGGYIPAHAGDGAGYYFWDRGERSDWAPTYEWFSPQNGQSWQDNDTYWTTTLPFDIRFCDVDFAAGASFYIGSNGILGFVETNMNEPINQNLPNGGAPNAVIAPLWDDLLGGSSGDISLDVDGAAPNRRWIISFSPWYFYGSPVDSLEFQVVISEINVDDVNNTIEFRYRDVIGDSWRDNGASATVGLENLGGTEAALYSFNQGIISNGLAIRFTDATFIDSQLNSFNLLTPEDNFHGRVGDNINLSWEASAYSGVGVVTYEVYLADNSELTDPLILNAGTNTSLVHVFGTGNEGDWYWSVKATETTLSLEKWAEQTRMMTIHEYDWAITETTWGEIKTIYAP
ncbi:hypothetical protein K8R78_03555 [bacterium]|nr:hypothetical protein [bacterium]